MPERDLITMSHESMRSAYQLATEMRRRWRRDFITAPAIPISDNPEDPVGTARPKKVRREWWRQTVADPVRLQALIAEQADRFGLTQEKPIPRSVVEEALEWGAPDEAEEDGALSPVRQVPTGVGERLGT